MSRSQRWFKSMPYWRLRMTRSHIPPGTKCISKVFWRGPVDEERETKDVRKLSTVPEPCWESRSSVFFRMLLSGSQSGINRDDRIGSPGDEKWGTHHCCYLQQECFGDCVMQEGTGNKLWTVKVLINFKGILWVFIWNWYLCKPNIFVAVSDIGWWNWGQRATRQIHLKSYHTVTSLIFPSTYFKST